MSKSRRFRRLWRLQRGCCHYCDVPMIRKLPADWGKPTPGRLATEDHRLPKSRGGRRSNDNIVLACDTCNRKKGALSEREFLLGHYRWIERKKAWDHAVSKSGLSRFVGPATRHRQTDCEGAAP